MNTINYKGVDYPTRSFTVFLKGTGEVEITIATQSLEDVLTNNGGDYYLVESVGTEEECIDCKIYYYVDDELITLPAIDICANHLDEHFELIEEL